MLHLTITISVAIPFKHKTSTQRCFDVGPASQTALSQQIAKSLCLLDPLNVLPFGKQIYIYIFISTKIEWGLLMSEIGSQNSKV